MAERISGLSISLDLETAQVDRSLSQIKRSFRSLQRSASVNMNNMKFDSKDITTYKKNLDALSKSYDSQKQNVDDIKKRMDQMTAAGKDNTEAFKDLNGEYNRQVDELNKLGHALEKAEDGLRGVYNESSRLRGVRDAFSGISSSLGNVGSSLQNVGGQMQSVGRGLTRSITTPALAAISAVGGITAAFGWSRLVGLDSAQAQLKGLGYNTEEVGRISGQVTSAIEGGMTTMAEGTSIAAGALAAGVQEGAELEKYIKLVGDAAVGSNRPVGEMAQIFNRVQGTGKLMTQELNMIEDGMPGFAMAMSESLGVSQEEFRKMVTNGEVSSEQFLTVMDDFAGGMATAYADSWQGMLANTKAYIGIIGENLLSGVFEQSKESIAEFIEFLKSDEVVEWAKTTGVAIGDAFSRIVEKVQEGITWFKNLDTEQQKLIGKLSLVAVAAGPVLTVLGSITIFVGSVVSALGGMFGVLASVTGGIMEFTGGLKLMADTAKKTGSWMAGLSKAFPKLGKVVGFVGKAFSGIAGVFTRLGGFVVPLLSKGFTLVRIGLVALTGPVGIVIGVISALAAGFVFAYKKSETFRNFIDGLREKFMQGIEWIAKFKDGILGLFKDEGDSGVDILKSIGLSDGLVQRLFDISGKFMEFYHKIKGGIQGIIDMFQGDWMGGRSILEKVGFTPEQILGIENFIIKITYSFHLLKERIGVALSAVKGLFTSVFNAITSWWAANGPAITGAISSAFQKAKDVVGVALNAVKTVFTTVFTAVKSWWDANGQSIIGGVVSTFNWLKETVGLALNLVLAIITRVFKIGQGIFSVFSTVVSGIWTTLWNVLVESVRIFAPIVQGIWNTLWSTIKNTIQIFAPIISGIVKTAINIITETFRIFKPIVLGIWNTLWPVVLATLRTVWEQIKLVVSVGMNVIQGIIKTVTAIINGNWGTAWNIIVQTIISVKDRIAMYIRNMKDIAINLFMQLAGGAINWFQNMWTNITTRVTGIKNSVVNRFTELKNAAIQRVVSMIQPVIGPFMSIYNGVSTRMSALFDILKYIFGLIRMTIVTAVRAVYQQVSTWFTNMYNRVSEVVQNVYNRVSAIFTNIYNRVAAIVRNVYNFISTTFQNIYNRISSVLQSVYTRVSTIFTNIYNRISSIVQNIYNRISSIFQNIYNRVASIVGSLRDRAISIFNNLRDRVVGAVTALRDRIVSVFTRIYNTVRDKMRSARDTAVNFATRMKDGAIRQFNNLADGARDMMDKVGQWIDNKKQGVVDKAKSLGTGIANAAIGGFNKMIGGINNVASLLGYNGNLISEIPTYSRGTKNHPGGLAVVGDKGPGNSPGAGGGGSNNQRELITLPNGKMYMANGESLVNMPKGTTVDSNKDTESMMAGSGVKDWVAGKAKSIGDFAKNTFNSAKDKVSGAFNNVKGFVSDIWDYATNPGKLVGDMISKLDFGWDLPTHALEFAKLGVNKLKDTVVDYVKGLFDDAGGLGDGSHILGKSITQTFGRYTGGINFNGGRHYGIDTAHVFDKLLSPVSGVITKIWNDFGGGKSIQMKAGKYNWWFMHMSKIMRKVGDTIKHGDLLGITGNTGNFTTGPHLHTQVMEGGVGNKFAINPMQILKNLKSHLLGGKTLSDGLFNLHGGEYIINPNKPSEAMKLLALAGKDLAGKSKQTRELPNVGGINNNGNNDDVVNALVEQNGILMKMLEKLTGIESKEFSLDVNEITKKQKRYKDDRSILV